MKYIKLKNSWGENNLPVLEVYLDGGWKENGNDMFSLVDPTSEWEHDDDNVDGFAHDEDEIISNSCCYYIDFAKNDDSKE